VLPGLPDPGGRWAHCVAAVPDESEFQAQDSPALREWRARPVFPDSRGSQGLKAGERLERRWLAAVAEKARAGAEYRESPGKPAGPARASPERLVDAQCRVEPEAVPREAAASMARRRAARLLVRLEHLASFVPREAAPWAARES
jgi:hypothetical protein